LTEAEEGVAQAGVGIAEAGTAVAVALPAVAATTMSKAAPKIMMAGDPLAGWRLSYSEQYQKVENPTLCHNT